MVIAVIALLALQVNGISAIGACPPDSGIYLMHRGNCFGEDAFFQVEELRGVGNELGCFLAGGDITVENSDGRLLYPGGSPVKCNQTIPDENNPFGCEVTNESDGVLLFMYEQIENFFVNFNGVYTCCLPGNCSDHSNSRITFRIFDVQATAGLYVTLPSDLTMVPQQYIVHCVVDLTCDCIDTSHSVTHDMFMEGTSTAFALSTCGQLPSLSCMEVIDNSTASSLDFQFVVMWNASDVITLGDFGNTLISDNGDHDYQCLIYYTSSNGTLKDESTTVTVRAPNFAPLGLKVVSTTSTSLTLSWNVTSSLSGAPDADGYIIYYGQNGSDSIESVNVWGEEVSEYTLEGLLPDTEYAIFIRAYQDILGPASGTIVVITNVSVTTSEEEVMVTTMSVPVTTMSIPMTTMLAPVTTTSVSVTTVLAPVTNMSVPVTTMLTPSTTTPAPMTTTTSVPVTTMSILGTTTSILDATTPVPTTTASVPTTTASVPTTTAPDPMTTTPVPTPVPTTTTPVPMTTTPVPMVTESLETTDALVSSTITPSTMVTQSSEVTSTAVSPATTLSREPQDQSDLLGIILIAAMVALLIMVVVVIVLIFVVYKKRKGMYHNPKNVPIYSDYALDRKDIQESSFDPVQLRKVTKMEEPNEVVVQSSTFLPESQPLMTSAEGVDACPLPGRETADFDPKIPVTVPVTIDNLASHVGQCHSNDDELFSLQYQNLYAREDAAASVGFSQEIKPFNRFRDIAPYNDNMIILKGSDNAFNPEGYINASFVDGFTMARKFIAAQGPMEHTVSDFWRMIWQERARVVVMVTRLSEGGATKCNCYWPSSQLTAEKYGLFTVLIVEEQVEPDIVIRKMKTWYREDADDFLMVTQYQFTSWPDHGIPDYTTPLMMLHQRVMEAWCGVGGTMVVHCSAGVGRTGTFIALDLALEQAGRCGVVDIAGITNRLRQQRMKMIQTEEQYIFLHDLVMECLLCGNTEIPLEKFAAETSELKKVDPQTGKSGLELQFEKLGKVCLTPNECMFEAAKQHPEKNRHQEHLPSNRWRVVLFQETPGYIHATYIKGFNQKRAFIIAQSPMETTERDFWKMVTDHKAPAIVMLLDKTEEDESVCSSYWTMEGDEYSVKEVSCEEQARVVKRKLEVTKGENAHLVTQFQILGWLADGQVKDAGNILSVIDEVVKLQQAEGSGPVIVHCSDTVSRSGVFCAASYALEQLKSKKAVDVFQAVKSVRTQKAGAVTSVEQYISVYELIDKYLSSRSSCFNYV